MRFRFLVLVLAALCILPGCKKKKHPGVEIVLSEAATSVWDDNLTVGTQFELRNASGHPAGQLRITGIEVEGGTYAGPASLPTNSLGDLPAGGSVRFDALLKIAGADGSAHLLTVAGNYRAEGKEHAFRAQRPINPDNAPPGPIPLQTGTTVKQDPKTVPYPTVSPAPPPFGPNSETPVFVPIGPPRQLFPPTPTGTQLGTSAGGAGVQIPRNTTMRNAGTPPDPNAAAAAPDGVVLATYNSNISYSTNGGQTFIDVNLLSPQPGNPARTTFFPQSDGGFCCDQVVVYLPGQNLFFWLLQYNPITACATNCPPQPPPAAPATFRITQTSRLRIAWATPAAVAADFWNAWRFVDLTGTALGTTNAEWLDYPDLAFSDTFLYVGIDHGFTTPGRVYTGRRIIARMSLADFVNPAAGSIGFGFAELTGSNGLNKTHFIQGAPGRMVVGSLDDSSTLRVFTCPDNENAVTPTTVKISQIPQGTNYTSTAPDGADWLAVSFPGNITGGVFRRVIPGLNQGSRDEYLFAFDAGANSGGGRPRAYLRLETLTPDGSKYKAIAEYDVWNNDYAYAMGGLGTDGSQIGITLAVGGGTIGFPQFAVGYKDDFVVYQVTNSNATQTTRFGDYVCNRPVAGGTLFATEVYDVVLNPLPPGTTSGTCATIGCSANMRFVEYGRPPAPPIR